MVNWSRVRNVSLSGLIVVSLLLTGGSLMAWLPSLEAVAQADRLSQQAARQAEERVASRLSLLLPRRSSFVAKAVKLGRRVDCSAELSEARHRRSLDDAYYANLTRAGLVLRTTMESAHMIHRLGSELP